MTTNLVCVTCKRTIQNGIELNGEVFCEQCRKPVYGLIGYEDPTQKGSFWATDSVNFVFAEPSTDKPSKPSSRLKRGFEPPDPAIHYPENHYFTDKPTAATMSRPVDSSDLFSELSQFDKDNDILSKKKRH